MTFLDTTVTAAAAISEFSAPRIRGALSEVVFDKIVQSLREAAGIRILGDPIKAVEQLQTRFNLSNDEKGSVLRRWSKAET